MPAQRLGLPPLFLERLQQIYPPRFIATILPTFSARRPTTLRANTLRTAPEAVRRSLQEDGFRLERVPWCETAFIVQNRSSRELTETTVYRDGQIYVQSLSSMLPPLVLDPQPGETVLDVTAAPGSKTTQMAALMRNAGRIVANDNNKPRFFRLMANVKLQGAACVECVLSYGETVWRRYGEAFDRVLVDAPCSAEGRFDTSDPKTLGYWKLRKVHEMMRKQKRLLYSGIRALNVGGTLVYSTCTFAPEENEQVVSWALEKFAGAIESQLCRVPVPNVLPPIAAWEGRSCALPPGSAVRILPTATMEGFFLAKLRKLTSIR